MCGATSLTAPTLFLHSGDGNPKVHFKVRGAKAGFLGGAPDDEKFVVDRARVCLQCGHVSLGFSAERLQELREKSESLEPAT
jgi:hypothetical protein